MSRSLLASGRSDEPVSGERIEPPNPHGRYRYGSWHGGPDPLPRPSTCARRWIRSAPRCCRRATYGIAPATCGGAGSTAAVVWTGWPSGCATARRGPAAGRPGRHPRPDPGRARPGPGRRTGGAGRAADDDGPDGPRWSSTRSPTTWPGRSAGWPYQWRSPEARATYESIKEMLQREVLDAQFAGMKQALESPDPEAMQRVKDMLADLNALLAAHARNEDTSEQFADFMAKHGEFFPEQPESVEELIDALARRQAAAQRMMASLTPGQRDQLAQLMQQAMSDADMASEMAQLADNLRALRPGLDRESPSGMRPGGESLGYSEAVEAVAELADLEALSDQLSQNEAAPHWTTSTWRCSSGGSAARRPGPAGAAGPRARTGAAGLPHPHRRRPAAHAAGGAQARPDRAETRLRAAGGVRCTATTTTTAPARPTSRPGCPGRGSSATSCRSTPRVRLRTHCAVRAWPAWWRRPRRRGLRGHRDRAADLGGRCPLRRPVVLDGGRRALGTDEADGARPAAPDRDPLPAGRAAGDRVQPAGAAAVARPAGRGGAGVDSGHQPAARAAARRAPPPAAPRRRAGGAGGHRRRAHRPPTWATGTRSSPGRAPRRPSGRPLRRSTN